MHICVTRPQWVKDRWLSFERTIWSNMPKVVPWIVLINKIDVLNSCCQLSSFLLIDFWAGPIFYMWLSKISANERRYIEGLAQDCSNSITMHWNYCSLAPSHRYLVSSLIVLFLRIKASFVKQWTSSQPMREYVTYVAMTVSWHGYTFCITGLVRGNPLVTSWVSSERASDAELWCFLWC